MFNILKTTVQLITICGTILLTISCSPLNKTPLTHHKDERIRQVFSIALDNISHKYIKRLSIKDLALSGLSGLQALDPSIKTKLQKESIELRYNQKVIGAWKIPSAKEITRWSEITNDAIYVAQKFSRKINLTDQEVLLDVIFENMLSRLDSFSRYHNTTKTKIFRARREGFGGIGISFKYHNDYAEVTHVAPNSPAEKNGLLVGDFITTINNTPVLSLTRLAFERQLHGPIMTNVPLEVIRKKNPTLKIFNIVREKVFKETITAKHFKNILHFRISSFNQNTAKILREKISHEIKQRRLLLAGIILDLRGNIGGILSQSIKIANMFLDKGKIITTSGRHINSSRNYKASGHDLSLGLPLIILIDRRSASAAEVLAASLQDQNRALVIGSSSFGKGTVQTVIPLPNNSELILTWSHFIAPSGYQIEGLGVRPAICTMPHHGTPKAKINNVLLNSTNLRLLFKNWRHTEPLSESDRRQLRKSCPQFSGPNNFELRLAKYVLEKPANYQNILRLSAFQSSH